MGGDGGYGGSSYSNLDGGTAETGEGGSWAFHV
jgi:hypothetical protein